VAVTEERLTRKFELMLPLLDERQQRALLGAEAQSWGLVGSAWSPKQRGYQCRRCARGWPRLPRHRAIRTDPASWRRT
jgi:hypothetical protein